MDRMIFTNIPELCDDMYQLAQSGNTVSAVCMFEHTVEIAKWLMGYDDINVMEIDMNHKDLGYEKEFYITLTEGEEGIDLFVEPAFSTDKEIYLRNDSDVCFFDGNVSAKVIEYSIGDTSYEIVLEDEDDDNGEDYDEDFWGCKIESTDCTGRELIERIIDYLFDED